MEPDQFQHVVGGAAAGREQPQVFVMGGAAVMGLVQDVYGGAYAAGCIYAPVDFVKKNPRTAQAVVNAMVRALRFIQQSTPEQIVAVVPASYYSDKAVYTAALKANLDAFKHDGSISMPASQNVYKDLKTFDPGLQNAASIDLAKTVDMSFQQKAAQKYR